MPAPTHDPFLAFMQLTPERAADVPRMILDRGRAFYDAVGAAALLPQGMLHDTLSPALYGLDSLVLGEAYEPLPLPGSKLVVARHPEERTIAVTFPAIGANASVQARLTRQYSLTSDVFMQIDAEDADTLREIGRQFEADVAAGKEEALPVTLSATEPSPNTILWQHVLSGLPSGLARATPVGSDRRELVAITNTIEVERFYGGRYWRTEHFGRLAEGSAEQQEHIAAARRAFLGAVAIVESQSAIAKPRQRFWPLKYGPREHRWLMNLIQFRGEPQGISDDFYA